MWYFYLQSSKINISVLLKIGKSPTEWKKANMVPVHKKAVKQILKSYWPISLLPIAGKMSERLFEYTGYLSFSWKIIWYLTISQVLDQVILALINSSLSLMKFINLLMIALKWELCFLTYIKHLIRFGTKVFHSN